MKSKFLKELCVCAIYASMMLPATVPVTATTIPVIYLRRKNPDACVGDESRINKVKRIFFFTAPKKEGFFFV